MKKPITKFNSRTHILFDRVFGRLTVVGYVGNGHWKCKCQCGHVKIVKANNLLRGDIKSCGCLKSEATIKRCTTHGKSTTPMFRVWASIISRCSLPSHPAYRLYGGRGITVCQRWTGRNGFECFLSDMGQPCGDKREVDRIDNDGPYSPENCRWATRKEQVRNSRAARKILFNGESRCISEWCELLGLPYNRTKQRLRKGWSVDDAFTKPSNARHRRS